MDNEETNMSQPNIINGPRVVPEPGTFPSYEFFQEHLSLPWYVNGIFLDDVEDILSLYKEMMLATKSPAEMEAVLNQFGWLAWDAKRTFKKYVNEDNFRRIKALIEKGRAGETMSPIVLPHVMLFAYTISKKYNIPQFPAACQFVVGRYFHKEAEAALVSLRNSTSKSEVSPNGE